MEKPRRHERGVTPIRPGILPDETDLRLCTLMLAIAIVDFSQISWWAGGTRPFGDLLRWLTVLLQAGYLAANAARIPGVARGQRPLLALIGFCAVSALWSLDPATSLLGALRLALLAGSIRVAQDRHGAAALARVFLLACAAILAANLAALAVPGVSIMTGTLAGAFRGLTDHKNTLGQFCGLTLAFLLAATAGPPTRRRAYALGVLLTALALTVWLSRSATAVVLSMTAVGLFLAVRLLQRTRHPLLLGILGLAALAPVAAAALAGGLDPLAALGRDATLTGRAEIWAFVELYVRQHPWLGYGYRAFPLADLLRLDPRWGLDSYVVGSTHNAYLAIVTEIGLLGLAAYAAWLALLIGSFPRHGQAQQLRAAMVLGVYLASGLSESFAGLSPGLYLAALLIAFPATRQTRASASEAGRTPALP